MAAYGAVETGEAARLLPRAGQEDVGGRASAQTRFLRDAERSERLVYVELVYVRYLSDVVTTDMTFRAAIGFDMEWAASEEDVQGWEADPVGFVPSHIPRFEFPNGKEIDLERRTWQNGNCFKINVKEDPVTGTETRFCFLRTLAVGVFMARFDLHAFPFDSQTLRVVMDLTFCEIRQSMFVPPFAIMQRGAGSAPNTSVVTVNREFSALSDFELERCLCEFASRTADTDKHLPDDEAFRWSQVVVHFQLVRKWEGYIGRLALLAFLLSLTSLAAFGFDVEDALPDRAGYLMNLVLANVAFQFILNDVLPPVPYLTTLDKYCLALFVLTVLQLCLTTLYGNLDWPPDTVRHFDLHVAMPAFTLLLVACQLGFVRLAVVSRRGEVAKLDMGVLELRQEQAGRSGRHASHAIRLLGRSMLDEAARAATRAENAFVTFASQSCFR